MIKYIDLFGGVGGFRLGIERATCEDNWKQESKWKRTEWDNIFRQRNITSNNSRREKSQQKQGHRLQLWKCVGYYDTDKYAVQTYNKNFHENHKPTDIRNVHERDIPDFDVLCAGFPCQSFSIAGKRRGFEDTRGTLFFEIARIARCKRPSYLFLENVKGLLSHDEGRTFATILRTLDELGYDAEWQVLNSKHFGVPQNRERVFIIGCLRGQPKPKVFPLGEGSKEDNTMEQREAMISNSSPREFKWQNISPAVLGRDYKDPKIVYYQKSDKKDFRVIMDEGVSPSVQARNDTHKIIYAQKADREIARIYSPEGIAPCLHLKTGGWQEPKIVASRGRNPNNPSDRTIGAPTEQRLEVNEEGISNVLTSVQKDNMVLEYQNIRHLTPLECERLQSFPDGWTEGVSDTQRYRQMGNAVTVNVIEAIVRRWNENEKYQGDEDHP